MLAVGATSCESIVFEKHFLRSLGTCADPQLSCWELRLESRGRSADRSGVPGWEVCSEGLQPAAQHVWARAPAAQSLNCEGFFGPIVAGFSQLDS